MTIIVFLIDTSASMNQRTYLGARPTLLDVAKDSVEKFLKLRQRDVASRQDRYMLLTFDEYPANIKAGWKENHNVFINELKNLTASGMTLLGPAIKNCFDLLNLNRMQTGIDTYGQGRSPFFLESSIIIAITDGGKLTNGVTVQEELNLPMNCNVPGAELTKEPFRWDQRLYALVLRLTGTPPTEHLSNGPPGLVSSDNSPIDAMCEVTGGRSYSISSQRSLMQCLESVVQKIQSGVVIQFEKVGPDPPPSGTGEEESEETNQEMPKIIGQTIPNGFMSNHKGNITNQAGVIISSTSNSSNNSTTSKPPWHSVRKLIYVHRSAQRGYSTGFWPIPESFWPDLNTPSLPPRTCHPIVKFTCAPSDPMVIDNLPFDKYELETSPLTQFILSRKQPHVAWQCFVSNSHKSTDHPLGYPFGYLKASTNLSCVNLFVLPYNYPVILPLLDELFKVHHCKPTREWKAQFDAYLKNIPLYYAGPLKRALQKMGGPNLVPDNMENCLSYSVLNLLKRLKNQAKVEFDKLVATVGTGKPAIPTTIKVPNMSSKKISDIVNMNDPCLKSRFSGLRNEINDFQGFSIRIRDKAREAKPQCYRNPYDITRHQIIDQIHRMRNNFLQPPRLIRFHDEDQIHNLPVSQMGNYQEYLKRMPTPLRELESAPVRQHMFGNPFKIDKGRALGMIDEADIDLVGGNSPVKSPKRPAVDSVKPFSPRHLKRRPGPLPKELAVQYMSNQKSFRSLSSPPSSPLPTPPSSPSSSSEASFSSASSSPTSSPCPSPSLSSPITLIPPNLSISPTSTLNNTTSNNNQFILHDTSTDSSEPLEIDLVHLYTEDDVEIVRVPEPDVTILSPPTSGQELTSEPSHRRKNSSISENNTNNDNTNSLTTESTNSAVHNSNFSATTSICNGISNSIGDHSSTNIRWTLSSEELEMKRELFRLVRKPGRNFQPILNQLSNCNGPLRDYLVKEIVSEATRFKRRSLIEMIERFGSESSLSTTSSRLG